MSIIPLIVSHNAFFSLFFFFILRINFDIRGKEDRKEGKKREMSLCVLCLSVNEGGAWPQTRANRRGSQAGRHMVHFIDQEEERERESKSNV